MTLDTRLATATQNTITNAWSALFNTGFLKIYDGTRPTDANTAIGAQVLLSTHTLSATAFATSASGTAAAAAIGSATVAATSTATWGRFFKADGTTVIMDVSVGVGASFNINVNSTAFQSGATASISSYNLTTPASIAG